MNALVAPDMSRDAVRGHSLPDPFVQNSLLTKRPAAAIIGSTVPALGGDIDSLNGLANTIIFSTSRHLMVG